MYIYIYIYIYTYIYIFGISIDFLLVPNQYLNYSVMNSL